jgi:ADP-ribose pyrophosphatase YjhB (NUDIX family)
VSEQPAEAAARGLHEETNLTADPADLVLFDAVSRQVVDGNHALVYCFAVDRTDTEEPIRADTDAEDARFFAPETLATADERFRDLAVEPERYRSFGWWHETATEALEDGGSTRN